MSGGDAMGNVGAALGPRHPPGHVEALKPSLGSLPVLREVKGRECVENLRGAQGPSNTRS